MYAFTSILMEEWPGCAFSANSRGGLREVNLEEFNALPVVRAEQTLLDCCGSTRWAARLAAQGPFTDLNDLRETADSIWRDLEPADWLEAFGRHPQIGERRTGGRARCGRKRESKARPGESGLSREIRIYLHRLCHREVRGRDACTSRTTLTK